MYIALDFGAGNFKRVDNEDGVVIPSQVSVITGDSLGKVAGLRTKNPPKKIHINGYGFFVGNDAHEWGRPIENLADDRFVSGSPELRALVYAALTGCEEYEQVNLIVGLPQSALGESSMKDTVTGLKSWLTGVHTWTCDEEEYSVDVNKVTITSQASGALFDYLLSDEYAFIPEHKMNYKNEIGIISVGMNTIEFLVVQNGKVLNRFTHSVTAGVRRLLELTDPQNLYSRGEMDSRLRDGSLNIKSALPIWASEVTGHIERAWGNAHKRFSTVVVVGGGALLLQNELIGVLNGRAYIPQSPVLAVARGLHKLATMKGH